MARFLFTGSIVWDVPDAEAADFVKHYEAFVGDHGRVEHAVHAQRKHSGHTGGQTAKVVAVTASGTELK